jgi:CRISPR-associated protein Csd1
MLHRLLTYGKTSPDVLPPFHARKPVRWVLDLRPDGTPVSGLIDLADQQDPNRRYGVRHAVPAVTRTVGIAPLLAADTTEYVFGWVSDDGKPDRVTRQHDAFVDLAHRWASDAPDDTAAQAVAAFYRDGHLTRVEKPASWSRGDLVAFRIDGQFGFATDSARRLWAAEAIGRKGLGRAGLCLVCGTSGPLLKTIPQQVPRKWVPGATQSASLVSINEAVHGYELRKFLQHTPICVDCGLTVMQALTSLLSDPHHSSTQVGQKGRLAWWLTDGSAFDPVALVEQPDEAQVHQLLASPRRGYLAGPEDTTMFCAMVVSGNAARIVVRDWIEMPLPRLRDNLATWFRDIQIVDDWTATLAEPKRVGVGRLALATGRWRDSTTSYLPFGGKGADRPDEVYPALMRAALLGHRLPHRLFTHLEHRIRADGRVDVARAALLRLALRRHPATTDPEAYMPKLNTDNREPAYVYGRIFAVFEGLQASTARAYGEKINATFTHRAFDRGLTNPTAALTHGQRQAHAWLKRLARRRPPAAAAIERRLDDLFALLPDTPTAPARTTPPQRWAFILGYHHQRAADRAARAANGDNPPPADPADPQPVHDREGASTR